MKETFSNNLKQFRKQKQLSQEQLAEQLGITTQAVSKWECSLSYPDIDLLPQLADLFGVSIDILLRGGGARAEADESQTAQTAGTDRTDKTTGSPAVEGNISFPQPDFPDDTILRIVQYRGKTLLRKDTYDPNIRIPLSFTCEPYTKKLPVEIWGSADIFGDLNGNANIGASVTCSGDINGTVNTGMNVECSGDINGDANAGGNIACHGDISGDTKAGGDISCDGDICGDTSADGSVSCGGDISGDVSAHGSVSCGGDMDGDVSAGGNISCGGDISGSATAGGKITYGDETL